MITQDKRDSLVNVFHQRCQRLHPRWLLFTPMLLLLSGARWFITGEEGCFWPGGPASSGPLSPGGAEAMEAPLTGSHLPGEQWCHLGTGGAAPHRVPLQANRHIMRLLLLLSLHPPPLKSSVTVDGLCLCIVLASSSHVYRVWIHYGSLCKWICHSWDLNLW